MESVSELIQKLRQLHKHRQQIIEQIDKGTLQYQTPPSQTYIRPNFQREQPLNLGLAGSYHKRTKSGQYENKGMSQTMNSGPISSLRRSKFKSKVDTQSSQGNFPASIPKPAKSRDNYSAFQGYRNQPSDPMRKTPSNYTSTRPFSDFRRRLDRQESSQELEIASLYSLNKEDDEDIISQYKIDRGNHKSKQNEQFTFRPNEGNPNERQAKYLEELRSLVNFTGNRNRKQFVKRFSIFQDD